MHGGGPIEYQDAFPEPDHGWSRLSAPAFNRDAPPAIIVNLTAADVQAAADAVRREFRRHGWLRKDT